MPRGVLLHGPPGTGKTLVAKATSAEAGVPVLYAAGSEFVEMYVGVGAKRVRALFAQARRHALEHESGVCLVFIDEIDAVGSQRKSRLGGVAESHREAETTLNQLLNEMDGFETDAYEGCNVLVIAATNLLANLDKALLRAGRFDHKIEIHLPNPIERAAILRIHLENKRHNLQPLDISKAATMMDGWSGAEIENTVNLAALEVVNQADPWLDIDTLLAKINQ